MSRIVAWIAVVIALCGTAAARIAPSSISGYVRNSSGVAQMGALVELSGGSGQGQVAYTDAKGYFSLTGVLPGNYAVKVTAPSFLPTLREGIALSAGSSKVLNITLTTLFEAVQMLPDLKREGDEDDSWKWTLRSTSNRPILRFDGNSVVVVESPNQSSSTRGTLAFMAGGASEGYGSAADLGTVFDVQQSIFHTGTLGFSGDLGYGDGIPDGVVRASYTRHSSDGWTPAVALTVRRFASPDVVPRHGALQALALSYADGFSIGDLMDFQFGGDMQAIQFLGREVNAFRPGAALDIHLTANTILEYRYATSEPNTRASKGFDTAPADLSESGPRMTMVNDQPLLENAHHHEISLSQRLGDNNKVQVAYFIDHIRDTALLGVGEIGFDTGDILPDIYSGTFSYNGGTLDARGVRFVFQHKFPDSITATIDYDYGGVLELEEPDLQWAAVRGNLQHGWRHSAALRLNGTIPRSHTRWIASYRWTSGDALTPVDLFNASAGQTDPFFNIFVRQPLPHVHGMPLNMEALIDLRNLLEQGYVPVIGPDGNTIYLMQSARCVRGGLAFSF